MHQTFPKTSELIVAKKTTTRFLAEETKHQTPSKTLLPFSQGLRHMSDGPGCQRCHPAGDHQSNKQSTADSTDASAQDTHPYKLLRFRQYYLVPISPHPPKKKIRSLVLEIHMSQNMQDSAKSLHLLYLTSTYPKIWLQPNISVILNI